MAAPVGGGDLIFDQRVHRGRVGHPQKRFGEAHQGDAFVGRKTVFGKEHLHQTGPGRAANGADQCGSTGADGGAGLGVKAHGGQVLCYQTGLVGQSAVLNDVPRCLKCRVLHLASPLVSPIISGVLPAFVLNMGHSGGRLTEEIRFQMPNDPLGRDDHAILAVLEPQGRISATEPAARNGRSKSPVQTRIKPLEAAGIIRGYRARLWRAVGPGAQGGTSGVPAGSGRTYLCPAAWGGHLDLSSDGGGRVTQGG